MGTLSLPLVGKNAEDRFVLIDEADLAKVQGHSLTVEKKRKKRRDGTYYENYLYERVRICVNGKKYLLHRYIMDAVDPNIDVNHKDGNTFNNTRENLEFIDHALHAKLSNEQKKRKKQCVGLSVTSTSDIRT